MTGVVFDVDDTLYLERRYVETGFRAVADHVATRLGVAPGPVFEQLWADFEAGVRGTAFDRLLAELAPPAGLTVAELVEVYRNHRPGIRLDHTVRRLLVELRESGIRLGVITDGKAVVQEAKIEALGLGELVDSVVLTGRWGQAYWKPHPRAFEAIESEWSPAIEHLWYVGDNPAKDFVTPRHRGWTTVRLRCRGQLHEAEEPQSSSHGPHYEIGELDEVRALLRVDGA